MLRARRFDQRWRSAGPAPSSDQPDDLDSHGQAEADAQSDHEPLSPRGQGQADMGQRCSSPADAQEPLDVHVHAEQPLRTDAAVFGSSWAQRLWARLSLKQMTALKGKPVRTSFVTP